MSLKFTDAKDDSLFAIILYFANHMRIILKKDIPRYNAVMAIALLRDEKMMSYEYP